MIESRITMLLTWADEQLALERELRRKVDALNALLEVEVRRLARSSRMLHVIHAGLMACEWPIPAALDEFIGADLPF